MASSDELILDQLSTNCGRPTTKRQQRMRSNIKAQTTKFYTKTWSDFEKQVLLNQLYEHGDTNLEKLAEGLPNKHVEQIKTYLRTISRRAQLAEVRRQKNQVVKNLDDWIKLLGDVYKSGSVDDSLPYHLFTLSKEFSKHNTELPNEIVDFQKAYEYLYTLTMGRKIDVDERTYYFVHSYIEWFLSEFDKILAIDGEALITSGLKTLYESNESNEQSDALHGTASKLLNLNVNKSMPHEFTLNYRRLLRYVCSKTRRTTFKKGDEYDRKISLLRAEIDYEPRRDNDHFVDPAPSELVPESQDFIFNNLPTFVWAALFNYSIDDLIQLSNHT